MLPTSGPVAIRIPGISGVLVTANTTGAVVKYRWPQTFKLGGIDMCVRSGSDVDLANTKLRFLDDSNQELAIDGFGTTVSMPMGAMRGIPGISESFGGRFQAFQRIVRAGDIWVFQIINAGAVDVIPELFFRLEAPVTVFDMRKAG